MATPLIPSNVLAQPLAAVIPPSVQAHMAARGVAIAKLGDVAGDLAVNLAIALAILAATFILSRWAAKLARGALKRWRRTSHDVTLQGFAASLMRYAVIIVGLIAVLRRLGVETTSIITVLGAASLAVGLALQGALSNVAAGVMLLILRPYQVGDFVTVAGKSGTVKRLDLFNTELTDPDNLKIVVPNGKAFGDVIINASELETRRMELSFGIGYADDIGRAIELAKRSAAEDPRLQAEPAPWANVTELAASSVTITLRAWAKPDVYWDARFDLIRRVKEAFAGAGLSPPYPTQVSLSPPAGPPRLSHPRLPLRWTPPSRRRTRRGGRRADRVRRGDRRRRHDRRHAGAGAQPGGAAHGHRRLCAT